MSALPSVGRKPLDLSAFHEAQARQPAQQKQPQQPGRLDVHGRDTFTPGPQGSTPGRDAVRRVNPQRFHQSRNGDTHCNSYTRAYLGARNVPSNQIPQGRANDMSHWLHTTGDRAGWRQVGPAEAQRAVNNGAVGMASWSNPNGHGHVTPLVEGTLTNGTPTVSHVGRGTPIAHTSAAAAFNTTHHPERQVEYWVRG